VQATVSPEEDTTLATPTSHTSGHELNFDPFTINWSPGRSSVKNSVPVWQCDSSSSSGGTRGMGLRVARARPEDPKHHNYERGEQTDRNVTANGVKSDCSPQETATAPALRGKEVQQGTD
jgi:hypothetical protein